MLDIPDPTPRWGRKVIPRLVQGRIYQNWYKFLHDRGRRPSKPGPTLQGARGGDVLDVPDPAPGQGWKVIPRLVQGRIYQNWYKAGRSRGRARSQHTGSGDVRRAPFEGSRGLYQSWYNFSRHRRPRRSAVHVPHTPAGTCRTPRIRHQRGPEGYTKIGTSPGVDMQHVRAGPGSAPARPRRAARPLSCQHPEARTHPAYPLGQVRPPRLEHL